LEKAPRTRSEHGKRGKLWTTEARFSVIVETAKLSETELSEYCREKGLYPEQVRTWKASFIAHDKMSGNGDKKAEAKVDKKRIIQLEKELRRKEKALAEAAALLILEKS
jgi:transposase